MKNTKPVAVIAVALAIAGCATVIEDADGITIRHSAENPLFADRRAQAHCAETGRDARLVLRRPETDDYIVRTRISMYLCVEKGGG